MNATKASRAQRLFKQANDLYLQGAFEEAIPLYHEVLETFSNDASS
jgi:TolA-binding protein